MLSTRAMRMVVFVRLDASIWPFGMIDGCSCPSYPSIHTPLLIPCTSSDINFNIELYQVKDWKEGLHSCHSALH